MPDYTAAALYVINRHRKSGTIMSDSLGKDLATQVFSQMTVVTKVFDLLPTENDQFSVGLKMIEVLNDAGLYALARFKEANALLKAIDSWIDSRKLAISYQRVHGIYHYIITIQTRIRNAIQFAGKKLNSYNPNSYRKLLDYEIPANGKKDVCWELPSEGNGLFTTYYRNDILSDGLDQVGTYQTIQGILTLAKAWKTRNTGAILEIGDISRAGGLDTSQHDTHEDGKAFDMRPIRNDGGQGKAFTWKEVPPYHRDWTKAFIKMVLNLYSGSIVYFNDPEIYDNSEFKGKVIQYADHDNHLHIIFKGGERGSHEGGK
jgi:hypothetical protein